MAVSNSEKSKQELVRNTIAAATSTALCVALMNPLDTLRIRYQVRSATKKNGGQATTKVYELGRTIVRQEGLWKGLYRPGIFMNMAAVSVSSGLRLGIYPYARDLLIYYTAKDGEKNVAHMGITGFVVGSLSFWLATPFFQAKTLAQAKLETKSTKNSTLSQIIKEQGIRSIFRGATPLMFRGAMFSAGAQMGYDTTKTTLKKKNVLQEGIFLHITASIVSAFASTLMSAPADRVMTNYQSAPSRGVVYRNVGHCIQTIYEKEGSLGYFRGWPLFLSRVLPLMMINMPLYELLRKFLGMGYLD